MGGQAPGFLGHVGAWAPRPEQIVTAAFLRMHVHLGISRAMKA
jgi:hypothetical protein